MHAMLQKVLDGQENLEASFHYVPIGGFPSVLSAAFRSEWV